MVCSRCGHETLGNYCNYCGAPLNREENSFGNEDSFANEEYEQDASSDCPALRKNRSRRKEKAKVKTIVKREKVADRKGRKEQKERNRKEERESRFRQSESRRVKELERRLAGLQEHHFDSQSPGETAVKGAAGVIVLASRIMQLLSALLMAHMVWLMTGAFIRNSEGLGQLETMLEERNFGLALYLGFSGISLLMGVLWCLWILTRKAGGGQVRLKTYDTGRGFLPFLFCTAVVFLAGPGLMLISAESAVLGEAAKGAEAALKAVNFHRDSLLFSAMLGAGLSLIRKILRV